MVTTGVAFTSNFATFGFSAPDGRSFTMRSIFSRTSVATVSTSRSRWNSSITWQKLFAHVAVMCFRPSTWLTASSILRTTAVSISSGVAPGYTTVTVTYGTSTSGTRSTPAVRHARNPKSARTSSTTVIAMGRFSEMSERNMTYSLRSTTSSPS